MSRRQRAAGSLACALAGAAAVVIALYFSDVESPAFPPAALATGDVVRVVDLPANDLVYLPSTDTIYASVPSTAGEQGNTITEINPHTGELGASVFVGSEPNKMAVSDDEQYIYVVLDGAGAIRRYEVATQTAGLQFSLGNDPYFGPRVAEDIDVMPGHPLTVAVSRRLRGPNISNGYAGLVIYDDGIERSGTFSEFANIIEFSSSADTLYAYNTVSTGFDFRRLAVGESGIVEKWSDGDLIEGFGVDIEFAGGRVYASSGRVIDPEAGMILGTFPTGNPYSSAGPMAVDVSSQRSFFLQSNQLTAFDNGTFAAVGSTELPVDFGRSLVRWGVDGVAFVSLSSLPIGVESRGVVLVETPLVHGQPKPTPTPQPIGSPTETPTSTVTTTPTATVTPTPADDPAIVVDLAASYIVYLRSTDTIYASVGINGGPQSNSIVEIDPHTGNIERSVPVGNEPWKMAASDDERYIYVGLYGEGSVSRYDVASHTVALQFSLGSYPSPAYGPYYVDDIEVVPGSPETVAISRMVRPITPRHQGVTVYDDGVQRPNMTAGHTGSNAIEFGSSPSVLYGVNTEGEYGLRTMEISASGVAVTATMGGAALGGDFAYADGRVFGTSGRVLEPETSTLLGTFAARGALAVEPDGSRVFMFYQPFFFEPVSLKVFNPDTFTPVGTIDTPIHDGGFPLIRWGDDGLAYISGDTYGEPGRKIVLIRSPLVGNGVPPATPWPTRVPSPTATLMATSTPARPKGDVGCDGQVTSVDALLLLQWLAGSIPASLLPCLSFGDANGDGQYSVVDALLILQYDAGLLSHLPP